MMREPDVNEHAAGAVRLREATAADIATLFAFESDPAWGNMAMVKPRSAEAFAAVWEKIIADRAGGLSVAGVVQKVIVVDGPKGAAADAEVCGAIGCRLVEGEHMVGYGLGRVYWGRGIASRALGLLLQQPEVQGVRPLYARVAASNAASIRVLEKHGFRIINSSPSPETERYRACVEVKMQCGVQDAAC